jgi:hypothetical protein
MDGRSVIVISCLPNIEIGPDSTTIQVFTAKGATRRTGLQQLYAAPGSQNYAFPSSNQSINLPLIINNQSIQVSIISRVVSPGPILPSLQSRVPGENSKTSKVRH